MGDQSGDVKTVFTRRQILKGAAATGAAFSVGALLDACGAGSLAGQTTPAASPKRGGVLRVGILGGSNSDTLDGNVAVTYIDFARCEALYNRLVTIDSKLDLKLDLAESIEPNADASVWTIRLKPGLTFHNGKTVSADDVIFTFQRMLNPQAPETQATALSMLPLSGLKKMDDRTVRMELSAPTAIFESRLSWYSTFIIPVGYDPTAPVGTGPFRFQSFQPGQTSDFTRFENYHVSGQPYVDELRIIDFGDSTARLNALVAGQLDMIDNIGSTEVKIVNQTPSLRTVRSVTGTWTPFTMRVDAEPFKDARVRQAMRLVVDRKQMLDLAIGGQGSVGNDIFSRYSPCYDSTLPQRTQDIEQAKSLLHQAGRDGLTVDLTTADVANGLVQAAQVLAQQAASAGINIRVNKVTPEIFYGNDYLSWTFSQDFWPGGFDYLNQVASSMLQSSPFNETHWNDSQYAALYAQAVRETDADKRCQLIKEMQRIDYDQGGYIIPYYLDNVDAVSTRVAGLDKSAGLPLNNYRLDQIWFS